MSKADKAPGADMEEILASIRRIIADGEAGASAAGPDFSTRTTHIPELAPVDIHASNYDANESEELSNVISGWETPKGETEEGHILELRDEYAPINDERAAQPKVSPRALGGAAPGAGGLQAAAPAPRVGRDAPLEEAMRITPNSTQRPPRPERGDVEQSPFTKGRPTSTQPPSMPPSGAQGHVHGSSPAFPQVGRGPAHGAPSASAPTASGPMTAPSPSISPTPPLPGEPGGSGRTQPRDRQPVSFWSRREPFARPSAPSAPPSGSPVSGMEAARESAYGQPSDASAQGEPRPRNRWFTTDEPPPSAPDMRGQPQPGAAPGRNNTLPPETPTLEFPYRPREEPQAQREESRMRPPEPELLPEARPVAKAPAAPRTEEQAVQHPTHAPSFDRLSGLRADPEPQASPQPAPRPDQRASMTVQPPITPIPVDPAAEIGGQSPMPIGATEAPASKEPQVIRITERERQEAPLDAPVPTPQSPRAAANPLPRDAVEHQGRPVDRHERPTEGADFILHGAPYGGSSQAAPTQSEVMNVRSTAVVPPRLDTRPYDPHASQMPQAEIMPPNAAGGRSLEETVKEMLRPMLRQWLNENMPRILEKVAREEIAARGAENKDKR